MLCSLFSQGLPQVEMSTLLVIDTAMNKETITWHRSGWIYTYRCSLTATQKFMNLGKEWWGFILTIDQWYSIIASFLKEIVRVQNKSEQDLGECQTRDILSSFPDVGRSTPTLISVFIRLLLVAIDGDFSKQHTSLRDTFEYPIHDAIIRHACDRTQWFWAWWVEPGDLQILKDVHFPNCAMKETSVRFCIVDSVQRLEAVMIIKDTILKPQ